MMDETEDILARILRDSNSIEDELNKFSKEDIISAIMDIGESFAEELLEILEDEYMDDEID